MTVKQRVAKLEEELGVNNNLLPFVLVFVHEDDDVELAIEKAVKEDGHKRSECEPMVIAFVKPKHSEAHDA